MYSSLYKYLGVFVMTLFFVSPVYADTLIYYFADTNDIGGSQNTAYQTVDCGTGKDVNGVVVYGYGNGGATASVALSFNNSASSTITLAGYPTKTWATSTFATTTCTGTGTIWLKWVSGQVPYYRGLASGTYTGGVYYDQYNPTGADITFKILGSEPTPEPEPEATTTPVDMSSTTEAIYSVGYSINLYLGIFTALFFGILSYMFFKKFIP